MVPTQDSVLVCHYVYRTDCTPMLSLAECLQSQSHSVYNRVVRDVPF